MNNNSGPAVYIPPDLPDDPSITYNPLTHRRGAEDSGRGSSSGWNTSTTRPTAPPPTTQWRVSIEQDPNLETDVRASGEVELPSWDPQPVEYALRRVIAKGGYGEIWEATQTTLGRAIAVKRLRPDIMKNYDSDGLRRLELAFRQEAMTAATLEHPNILPVHDLGLDENGNLLLAMKLVRGKPWYDFIVEDWLMPVDDFLQKHLGILIEVTQAVAFAHSRGIVHRDLKPSQVMVGEFGEVLLMDWGIAMFYDTEKAEGTHASRLSSMLVPTRESASNPAGTVAYMAPEQTEDTPDNIGPWTDVYLLGGVLYELLTGRRPHPAPDRSVAFLQARLGDVEDPISAAAGRAVPTELIDIAMRALARERSDRQQSAEEFRDELRDFLSGAGKRREAQRIARDTAARMATVAMEYKDLATCLGDIDRALDLWPGSTEARRLRQEILIRYSRSAISARDLKLARLMTERLQPGDQRLALSNEVSRLEVEQQQADERLRGAYQDAQVQRDNAELARRRAEDSHTRAERLLTFLLQDLYTNLTEVNRLDLLEKVSKEAFAYFETVRSEEASTADQRNRALALRNIGDVFRGQGNLVEALKAYRNYQSAAALLMDRLPGDSMARQHLAESHDRIGTVLYYQGDLIGSLREQGASRKILEQLAVESPDDPEIQNQLGHCLHQVGVVHWRQRELDQAVENQSASLKIFERLVNEFPERLAYRTNLGWNLGTYGNLHRDLGQLQQAIEVTERSVQIRQSLVLAEPDNKTRLDDLCWSSTNLALLREYVGGFEAALDSYDATREVRQKLVEGDMANAHHRNTLAFILSSMGRVLYGLARYAEAEQVLKEAVSHSIWLVKRDPTNIRETGAHALNQGYLGQVVFAQGKIDEAAELESQALLAARQALDRVPQNGVFQNAMCQTLLLRGLLMEHAGRKGDARSAWESALGIIEPLPWKGNTGQGLGLFGELCLYIGRHDDARASFQEMRRRQWMMPRWELLEKQRGSNQ